MDSQNTSEDSQNKSEEKRKGDSFLVSIPERKLVCVEYPGRVVNIKRALETLGGEETITHVTNSSNQRLPLHFRPDDIYSKPVFANRYSTTNMLLKVTKKKGGSPTEPQTSSSTAQGDDEYTCEMMGTVDSTYKFEGMCDYQYLPVQSKADGSFKSVLQDLVPDTVEDGSFLDKDPQELFLVPGHFSRMDTPSNYLYQKPAPAHKYIPPIHENLIGKRRRKRAGTAYLVRYDVESIPTEPQEEAAESVTRLNLQEEVEILRKLFQDRPMYSRIALAVCSKLPLNTLKTLLPAVAYYFLSGPWRTAWCRLGFDPREDNSGRMYQVVDFRIRKHVLAKAKEVIQPLHSRGLFNVPAKQMRRDQKGASVPIEETIDRPLPCEARKPYTEANYILKEDVLPAHYQMCYQFCDLHIKELQNIITEAKVREKCDQRFGWWDQELCNRLRNEMTRIVERTVLRVLQENEGSKPDDVAVGGEDEEEEGEEDYDRAEDSYDEDEMESDNEEDTELLEYLEPMDT